MYGDRDGNDTRSDDGSSGGATRMMTMAVWRAHYFGARRYGLCDENGTHGSDGSRERRRQAWRRWRAHMNARAKVACATEMAHTATMARATETALMKTMAPATARAGDNAKHACVATCTRARRRTHASFEHESRFFSHAEKTARTRGSA
jgi:hypothetical protein